MQFAAIGAASPFVALWLDARGIAPSAIGVILAAPSLLMIATTVSIGIRLDALADRRRGIVLLSVAVLGLNGALAFADGVWTIGLLWTSGGVLMHALAPAVDALALGVARRDEGDWARTRLFGSLGFVVAVLGAGALYERMGIELFLGVLIAFSVLRLWAARALPTLASAPAEAAECAARDGSASPLSHPGVLLTLAGAATINASHAFFYGFGLLAWREAGIGETLGGALWSAGIAAEIALMWRFRAIAARFSARACLFACAAAGTLRWTLTAAEPSLAVLFLAQSLHAFTFGLMYLATGTFIARRVAEREAARGQALSATFSSAAMAAATWGSGLAYERVGMAAYGAMAALCVIGALLLGASYRFALAER